MVSQSEKGRDKEVRVQKSKRVREGGIWCAGSVAVLCVSAAPVRDENRLAS